MKFDDLLKLVDAVEKSGLDFFELEEGETRVKMKRRPPVVHAAPVPELSAPPAPPEALQSNEVSPVHGAPDAHDIVSPLVGIFHELSGGKAVKIGDKLKKGSPVCLIEAMKLMNEINMPEDGEIVWIAAEEGSTVEYDQILFSYVRA